MADPQIPMMVGPPGGGCRVSQLVRVVSACSSAAWPAYDARWVELAARTLKMTLLGLCGAVWCRPSARAYRVAVLAGVMRLDLCIACAIVSGA